MDGLANSGVFLFESFRLDRRAGVLFRHEHSGAVVPIGIGSRALDVLGVLVERAGDLVSRDQIITAVWPATAVGDNNLNMQIAALRRVLDDGRPEGSCIQTVPGHGYRFVAPGTWGEASPVSISRSDNGAGRSIADAAEPSAEFAIDGSASPPIQGAPHRLRRAVVAAVAGALFLVGTVLAAANWRSLSPWGNGVAPRLSIVVLPFANLNKDPDQQYFPDGITEDLTTDLSRIANMFVISRNTAFTYRGKRVDSKQIGRELGVRYVLEGSVQRSGNRVRVTAQLIDAETDAHVWAERFYGDAGDLFVLQDEITGRIAIALDLELIGAEAARPAEHPDALDYILRGRAASNKPQTRDTRAEAISMFEAALTVDPRAVEAQSRLAI